jgi:hypothetical protein
MFREFRHEFSLFEDRLSSKEPPRDGGFLLGLFGEKNQAGGTHPPWWVVPSS